MKNIVTGILIAGLIVTGCSKSPEPVTKDVNVQKVEQNGAKSVFAMRTDIANSILSGITKYIKKPISLDDLNKSLHSPQAEDDEAWIYQDSYGKYTFQSDGQFVYSIKIDLTNPKEWKYTEAFKLLGLDIKLGDKTDSEDDQVGDRYIEYNVQGKDAKKVVIEKFSGSGGSGINVTVKGAFQDHQGSVLMDCDKDGFVKKIELSSQSDETNTDSTTADDSTNSGSENVPVSPNGNPFPKNVTVQSLIKNNIRIGDNSEALKKVDPNQYQYHPQISGSYPFYLSSNLYGYISSINIISELTLRFDSDPISIDKANKIITSILPKDAVLLDTNQDSPYTYYHYKSPSHPSLSVTEVKVGSLGGSVQVIGIYPAMDSNK